MKQTVILYASVHHGNTRKVAEHLARQEGVTAVDLLHDLLPDLGSYDLVGFASGIYFQAMHQRVRQALDQAVFRPGQAVFFLYTCGAPLGDGAKGLKKILAQKGVPWAGVRHLRPLRQAGGHRQGPSQRPGPGPGSRLSPAAAGGVRARWGKPDLSLGGDRSGFFVFFPVF